MTRHTKTIIFLSIGQVLCLACGLWISDKFSSLSLNSGPPDVSTVSTSNAGAVTTHQLVSKILTVLWIGGLQAGVAYLAITRLRKETEQNDVHSSMQILHREKDLVRTRNAVIFGLAKLAEHRDQETGKHLERIALYSKCLASALRNDARYREVVSASFVRLIGISSVLHDIGKVAVSDAILRKHPSLLMFRS